MCSLSVFLITFLSFILILSNDNELNSGPKRESCKRTFSIAHWNLNSIATQNFVKLSQLEALNTLHTYDLICLPETWLDSTTSIDCNDLSMKGYNLHRVDDPKNVKKGGVCVYYKETLAVQILQTKLNQCIVSEVTFKNKKVMASPCIDHHNELRINFQLFEELLQDIFNFYCFIPLGFLYFDYRRLQLQKFQLVSWRSCNTTRSPCQSFNIFFMA